MNHFLKKSLITCIAAMAMSTAQAAEEKIVNVYNWSDYIDEEILAEFEAETGIKVVYDVFDSNDILETKLLAGATGYDVVVPSAGFLARQIQAGVFQKLDMSKLDNYGNMWDIAYGGSFSTFHVHLPTDKTLIAIRANRDRSDRHTITWEDEVYLSWSPQSAVVLTE